MADLTIDQLPSSNPAQDADVVPVSRAGTTISVTAESIAALAPDVPAPTTLELAIAGGSEAPTPLITGEIPPNMNPNVYSQDADGDWHTYLGVDTQTTDPTDGPPAPAGTPTILQRTYFRDTLTNQQIGKNAFLSVNHTCGVGTVSATNQDRALWLSMANVFASTGITSFSITSNQVTINISGNEFRLGMVVLPTNFVAASYINGIQFTVVGLTPTTVVLASSDFTHADVSSTSDTGNLDQVIYAMACLQAELDINGTPAYLEAVDSELNTVSLECSDTHQGNGSLPSSGVGAMRAEYFRQNTAGAWNGPGAAAINAFATNDSTLDAEENVINGINIFGSDGTGASVNLGYQALHITTPTPAFPFQNIAVSIDGWTTGTNDWALFITSGKSFLGGTLVSGNTDFAGQATVSSGSSTEAFSFAANYLGSNPPIINLTPTSDVGSGIRYWVVPTGSGGAWTGFTIHLSANAGSDVIFNYTVIGQ